MTLDIEQIKREIDQSMTEYRHYRDNRDMARSIVNKTIDYLHSCGYLGGVQEWQPIETAPKGESWILTTQDGEVRSNCCFNFDLMNVSKSNNYKRWFTHENPTHWMPLPAAPDTFNKEDNVNISSEQVDAVKVCAPKGETK